MLAKEPDAEERLQDATDSCRAFGRGQYTICDLVLMSLDMSRTCRDHMRDGRGDLNGEEPGDADQEAKDALFVAKSERVSTSQGQFVGSKEAENNHSR